MWSINKGKAKILTKRCKKCGKQFYSPCRGSHDCPDCLGSCGPRNILIAFNQVVQENVELKEQLAKEESLTVLH